VNFKPDGIIQEVLKRVCWKIFYATKWLYINNHQWAQRYWGMKNNPGLKPRSGLNIVIKHCYLTPSGFCSFRSSHPPVLLAVIQIKPFQDFLVAKRTSMCKENDRMYSKSMHLNLKT